MATVELSEPIQDYLKALYKIEADGARATTSAVAARMGVSAPSATAMLKRLAVMGLVAHAPYRGAELTDAGERIALEVVRHHRLIEKYLVETLGLEIDAVHVEADRLEHALSEELEERIDRTLGYPTHDPHGDPIPDRELRIESSELRSLATLEPGEKAVVRRVPDHDDELLRYLSTLGLVPGGRVEVSASEPFDGPLTLRIDGAERPISRELAGLIGVS